MGCRAARAPVVAAVVCGGLLLLVCVLPPLLPEPSPSPLLRAGDRGGERHGSERLDGQTAAVAARCGTLAAGRVAVGAPNTSWAPPAPWERLYWVVFAGPGLSTHARRRLLATVDSVRIFFGILYIIWYIWYLVFGILRAFLHACVIVLMLV